MQLSETVKLYITREEKTLITATMTEYINTVNSLVSDATNDISISKYTTAFRIKGSPSDQVDPAGCPFLFDMDNL